MLKRLFIIIGLATWATACSSGSNNAHQGKISESDDTQLSGLIENLENGNVRHKLKTNRPQFSLGDDKALAAVYNEWAGTRYRMGGTGKHELRKGDLVFFRRNSHVGVYLGNNQFMHASTSQGVTISSLDEDYWAKTYTQSRRIM